MSLYGRGITLRSLLENPELLAEPIQKASDKVKDLDDTDDYVASQLAFLGPNIWERTLPSSLVDLNIESFGDVDTNVDFFSTLLDVDSPSCSPGDLEPTLTGVEVPATPVSENLATVDATSLQVISPGVKQTIPGTSAGPRKKNSANSTNAPENVPVPDIFPNSLSTPTSNFCPSPDELSQMSAFSVSGDEAFDPSKRPFSDEELRLQPVLKKSRKIFVPDDLKDDKYWARRIKNNTAAKRSREARRLKENQITMRTAFLEKENALLKIELQRILVENKSLKSRVEKYEAIVGQQSC